VPYGFAPDLIVAVGLRLGRDVEVQVMPYLRTLHALKTGQIDMTFGLEVPSSSVYLPENIIAASSPQLILPVSFYALPERKIRLTHMKQAGDYRIGTIRLETKGQRIKRKGHGEAYYYKNAYSLSKALQAHHIDLATLEPGSAKRINQELGVELERIYDYNHMNTYPIFSKVSPRIRDPLAFCQRFVEARIKAVEDGTFDKLLKDTRMEHLRPYYNQVNTLTEQCRITTSADQTPDAIKSISP